MARVLHMADMHLGSSFASRIGQKAAQLRRSEQRAVFSKIITLAKDCDVLLISGDLFDSENIGGETVKFIKKKFSEIPNTRVFIAAGNHDIYDRRSIYENTDFGENVHVFSMDGENFCIDDIKLSISGVSFGNEDGGGMCSVLDMKKHEDYTNIAVLHGNVKTKKNPEDKYNPITLNEIEKTGFDYIALGHVHTFSGFNTCGETVWAYPGIPEARGFDECGKSGVILLDINDGEIKYDFKEVCERRAHEIEIVCDEELNNSESVLELICEKISAYDKKDLFKVILKGKTEDGFKINTQMIKKRLMDSVFFIDVIDNTEEARNIEADDSDMSLRAVYIRMLKEKIDNAASDRDRQIALMALNIGVDALDGRLNIGNG